MPYDDDGMGAMERMRVRSEEEVGPLQMSDLFPEEGFDGAEYTAMGS